MTNEQRDARNALILRLAITASITIIITLTVTILSARGGGFASNNAGGERVWTIPIIIHLATVLPAFLIGGAMLLLPKGTRNHKLAGRIYVALMLVTATATIFIGTPGTGIGGSGFSFIHIFTVITFMGVPYAIWAAKTGRIDAHRSAMQGMFVGLCIAGGFAMLPGRLLATVLF